MVTSLSLLAGWALALFFALLAIIVSGMGGKVPLILILGISLIVSPLFSFLMKFFFRNDVPWWGKVLLVIGLWGGVVISFIANPSTSIYRKQEYREKIQRIYAEKLSQWPTAYESRYIDTEYGKVHVIVSGPEDGKPVVLINASALAGWSWIYNVSALNAKFRTYAIDNIGEAGRNEMKRPNYKPNTGPEIAQYYSDICDKLDVEKAHVIGASVGGYISTNFTRYAPDRVDKLVLLGSMGYGFTLKTILSIMICQGLPIKPIQKITFDWAFGDAPQIKDYFGEWFTTVMVGMTPTPIFPKSLKAQELQKIKSKTLAYFGTKDMVVGNAQKAKVLAENIPNVKVNLVESGHLIGAELAETVNNEVMEFLSENE